MSSLTAIDCAALNRMTTISAPRAELTLRNARIDSCRSEYFGGLYADLYSCESRQVNELELFVPAHCLVMRCEGRASRCEILWLDENRRQPLSELRPGSILFCPAFRRVRVTKKDSGFFDFLSLQIPPSALDDVVDTGLGAAHLRLSPQAGIGQANLCRILFAMRDEIENPGPAGRLYNETLALQLLIQLLRHASDLTMVPAVAKGGLSARQLRLAIELFDAEVTQAPSLTELAAHVGLSPTHFCTAFRQSTGHPPHRYLLNRRVARAKSLMADPGLSLTEIALGSGFGSSSQFATAFRRITGTTPSAHRRSL